MVGKVVVITGTPGVGKTTVAQELSKRIGAALVDLNALAAEVGGITGEDKERGAKVVKTGPVRKALRRRLKDSKGPIIIEGHFGEIVPPEFVNIAVVLRTNPLVLAERLRRKGYSERKVKENAEAELLDSCLISAVEAFGLEKVKEVDTTDLNPDQATTQTEEAIRGEGGLPVGSISWISKLENEGKLRDLIS